MLGLPDLAEASGSQQLDQGVVETRKRTVARLKPRAAPGNQRDQVMGPSSVILGRTVRPEGSSRRLIVWRNEPGSG